MSWHTGPMALFDLETTGVDAHRDRIVTAAVIEVGPDRRTATHEWMANPGIEIPEGASAVHGITTEQAQASGLDPAGVVFGIVQTLQRCSTAGAPIVGMNIVYDLTMLHAEALRHCGESVAQIVANLAPIIDVFVLDKKADPYRKGKRRLVDLAEHYGVALSEADAHGAAADALAAGRIAWQLGQRYAGFRCDATELHVLQVAWKRVQAESFAAYLVKTGKADDVAREWPIVPAPADWTPQQLPVPAQQGAA